MNHYESVGVDAIKLVRVAFTSDVETSYALIRYLWYCCISATSSFVKSTITNGGRPLAVFTKAFLFLVFDSI